MLHLQSFNKALREQLLLLADRMKLSFLVEAPAQIGALLEANSLELPLQRNECLRSGRQLFARAELQPPSQAIAELLSRSEVERWEKNECADELAAFILGTLAQFDQYAGQSGGTLTRLYKRGRCSLFDRTLELARAFDYPATAAGAAVLKAFETHGLPILSQGAYGDEPGELALQAGRNRNDRHSQVLAIVHAQTAMSSIVTISVNYDLPEEKQAQRQFIEDIFRTLTAL